MPEYIERERLRESLKCHYHPTDQEYESDRQWAVGYNSGLDRALHSLHYAPAADVAPVVRCRHCQSHHWEQEPCHGKTVHYCKKLNAEVTADFFCAAGKRKDGEGK